jgi:hypothetical protein
MKISRPKVDAKIYPYLARSAISDGETGWCFRVQTQSKKVNLYKIETMAIFETLPAGRS